MALQEILEMKIPLIGITVFSIIAAIVIIVVGYLVSIFVSRYIRKTMIKAKMTKILAEFTSRVVKILIIIFSYKQIKNCWKIICLKQLIIRTLKELKFLVSELRECSIILLSIFLLNISFLSKNFNALSLISKKNFSASFLFRLLPFIINAHSF